MCKRRATGTSVYSWCLNKEVSHAPYSMQTGENSKMSSLFISNWSAVKKTKKLSMTVFFGLVDVLLKNDRGQRKPRGQIHVVFCDSVTIKAALCFDSCLLLMWTSSDMALTTWTVNREDDINEITFLKSQIKYTSCFLCVAMWFQLFICAQEWFPLPPTMTFRVNTLNGYGYKNADHKRRREQGVSFHGIIT